MTDLSLKSLFFSDGDDEELADASLIDLESDIKDQLPKLALGSVKEEVSSKIGEVLDVGLDDVMVSAWKKYEGFLEYADPEKHPPEETILVPLAKHQVQSAHKPHVDLKIKDVMIGSIQLDVQVALKLEGIVLKVQGGKIHDLRAGSCQASGSLKCSLKSKIGSKDLLNLKKETGKFQLKGAVQLGDGIPIPGPGEAEESSAPAPEEAEED